MIYFQNKEEIKNKLENSNYKKSITSATLCMYNGIKTKKSVLLLAFFV